MKLKKFITLLFFTIFLPTSLFAEEAASEKYFEYDFFEELQYLFSSGTKFLILFISLTWLFLLVAIILYSDKGDFKFVKNKIGVLFGTILIVISLPLLIFFYTGININDKNLEIELPNLTDFINNYEDYSSIPEENEVYGENFEELYENYNNNS